MKGVAGESVIVTSFSPAARQQIFRRGVDMQARQLPSMPPIGQPESYYARQAQFADKLGDPHLHESYKVGQYISLALEPNLAWEKKLKYFDHALRRHCTPPPLPDEDVWLFYSRLADLVRLHCGEQALKLASRADDEFADMLSKGIRPEKIVEEAEPFFAKLMGLGNTRPNHFSETDWMQLKLIRDHWI